MAEKKSAVIPWLQPQETEEETPKTSSFGSIFDNISAWGNAAYANTRELGMGRDIKNTFDKLYNRQYSDSDEKAQLIADLDRLQAERDQYRNDFQENQEILNQNDSYLKDFTEIGGTLQGIGTQVRDTAIGAGLGAIGGSVVPVAGTASGAMTGARIGNFIGSIDQAVQDADMNAIDAWERVLQEGGTPDQAEQAYKDAFWANMPTEAMDIISSMYMGGKLLGGTGKILNRALGGKLAGTLASGVNKVARFDLPAKVGTYVANKSGKAWLGQGVGVGLGMLENAVEEGVQEPWQDYETERAIDKQRRIYDPTNQLNKDVRDHSIFGDGGLLDYYTTPEGMNTAIKAAKMGAVFGGAGGLMSKSQYTELGTAHSDSIQSARREADWIDKQGLLKEKGNLERYNNVKETMANIYDLSEDEKADLSVEDVARMYHEYYTNLFGQGGNRQEQNAVSQADFLNEITGEETTRRGLMGETATKYIDQFSLRPDNETLQSVLDAQQQEEQTQETTEQNSNTTENGEESAIRAKGKKGTFNNETKGNTEQNGEQKKRGYWDLPDKFGKQWERVEEGEGYDYGDESKYRNNITGRIANVKRVMDGKSRYGKPKYKYIVQDVTNPEENTTARLKFGKIGEFDSIDKVQKYLNNPYTNRQTAFQDQGQRQVSQALPKEDGVISDKDTEEVSSNQITTDAEGNQLYNGMVLQSKNAVTVHNIQDLHNYYKTHKDIMSADLYAEVSRQMMRFGVGTSNNTDIVLDLQNKSTGGARGSKTTTRIDPNDPNSAIAKAVVRLYAGADLATAAHEIAHLGWINLSEQDKETFTRWAVKTQGQFVARIVGREYDQNFRSYLIEALMNRGQGGSQTSQELWQKIRANGATIQTLGILNGVNTAEAVDERFAWEFSNWYAQGYVKGAKPRNIIERIMQRACASLQGALNLLYDTDRYLNNKESGYNGGEISDIFSRISATRKDTSGRVSPEQVDLGTEMRQPIQEAPYDYNQGFNEQAETDLYSNPQQNLGRNTGTVGSQTYTTPQTEIRPEQNLSDNTGTVSRNGRAFKNEKRNPEGALTKESNRYTPPIKESDYINADDVYQYVNSMQGEQPTTPIATGTPAMSPEEQYMNNIINNKTDQQEQSAKPKQEEDYPQWGDQYENDELLDKILKDKKGMTKTKGLDELHKKEEEKKRKAEQKKLEAEQKKKQKEEEKQRKAREKEKRAKLDALNKSVKDFIQKANKSLKGRKPSIDEAQQFINQAESSLNDYVKQESELRSNEDIQGQIAEKDQKAFDDYTKAINDLKSSLQSLSQTNENKSTEQKNITENKSEPEQQTLFPEIEQKPKTRKRRTTKKSSDTNMQQNGLTEKEERNLQILQAAFPNTKFQVSMAGHASRVNFPKFLLSYLGSGVGDQVHGWGLYFSLIPKTVKKYFNVFEGDSFGTPEEFFEKMNVKRKSNNSEISYQNYIDDLIGEVLSAEEQVSYISGEGTTVIDSLENRLFNDWLNDMTKDQSVDDIIEGIDGEIEFDNKEIQSEDLSNDIKDYIKDEIRELVDLKEFLENYVDKDIVFSFPKNPYKDNRTIYHVAIPDIKDMLNEEAKLKDQPKRIQKQAIKSFVEVVDRIERSPQGATYISRLRNDNYGGLSKLIAYDTFGENNNSTLIGKLNKKALLDFTGKELYDELVHALHYSIPLGKWDSKENRNYAKEAISKTLLKNGIQGISYIGQRDGLCAVVFNEDAVKIVSKFQQEEGKWKKLEVEKDTETENREREEMRKKALEKRNRKQDTKMQGNGVEDNFAIHSVSKDNKTTTMRRYNTGKTIDGTPIPKGDKTLIPVRVGKQMEKNIYFHKNYADRIVPKDKLEKAKTALKRDFPDFKYNCMMYNIKTGLVRFDEAPKFDTAREPITGRNITVNPETGHTLDSKGNRVKEKQIWHHKWMWVMDDYKGFDVQESKEWSQRWLKANEGKGSPSGWVDKWNNKLDELGLPHDDNTTAQDTKMQVNSVEEGLEQGGSSAGTSRKQVAAMFKKINWEKGTVNADIGGGKYDLMTEYVKERGVENIVFDPGNRTLEHNRQAVEKIQHRVDTATVANVLNVLPSIKDMKNVILQAAECLKPNGKAYFLMYEGDGKNKNKLTEVKKGQWQQNKPQKWYRPLLEERFGKENVKFKDGFYTCTNPIIKEGEKGIWSLDDTFRDNNVTLTYDNATNTKLQSQGKQSKPKKQKESKESIKLRKTLELQKVAKEVAPDAFELNAMAIEDPQARAFMEQKMRQHGWKQEEINELLGRLDYAKDSIVAMAKKYPLLQQWLDKRVRLEYNDELNEFTPVRNPFVSNGEYTLNSDFGTTCMKKEPMDAVTQVIIDMGMGQQLGSTQLELIKDILIKHKQITPCDCCFVEARRYRMLSDANKSAFDWKSVLIAAGIYDTDEKGNKTFLPLGTDRSKGSGNELTEPQLKKLREMADKSKRKGYPYKKAFEDYMPEERRRHKESGNKDLDTGTTPDKMAKIAKLILEDHNLAGELNPMDLISTRGTDKLALTYGGHTHIMSTLSGMYGSATSKLLQSFMLYDPRFWMEIEDWSESKLMKNLGVTGKVGSKDWLEAAKEGTINTEGIAESIYDFGGMRLQSFSDYNPILFLEYCQLIADCEARHLPMHTYTKVPYLVQLFGETGIMINMSFVPEIIKDEHDELDENGKLKHAGLKYNPKTGKFDLYAWHKDSFPTDLGYEYRKKYKNAGIIAVGVSDEHIRHMMRDPEIDMIIPYHSSGMPANVQIKTGLVYAKSYQDVQNMVIPDEAKMKFAKEHYADVYDKKMKGTPKQVKTFLTNVENRMRKVDLNYSRLLFETGDPRQAANKYLELCEKYGCTPVFPDFVNEDGYYKVLEDFRGYDHEGNAVLQKPVHLKFPEGFEKILEKSIFDRQKMKQKMNDIVSSKELVEDLKIALTPQRIDGEIRTQMMKSLRSALGKNNVTTLAKKDFFEELEKYYQSGLTPEEAKSKVEVFRAMNGTVYGFSKDNKIYLNENNFNANSPAHEFTHIWAKVAKNMNKDLWEQGKALLEKEASDLWHEVENDPLYGNIKDNKDAIASEVLARIVGDENVDFIKGQLDPNNTMGRGNGLIQRIKDWCVSMFNSVRSIFDNVNDRPLTYDEFVKMPLKALWDTESNEEFRKRTVDVIDNFEEDIETHEQTYEEIYQNRNQSDTKMQLHSEEGMSKADTNSPAFKEWFKGSILKNKDGSPQVLYRGIRRHYDPTYKKEEGNAVWLAVNKEVAEQYRDIEEVHDTYKGKPYNYTINGRVGQNKETGDLAEVYANIKKPFNFGEIQENRTNHEIYMSIGKQLKEDVQNGIITQEQMEQVLKDLEYLNKKNKGGSYPSANGRVWERFKNKKLFNAFKSVGYDSIKAIESGELTYGVLDKGNVKSIYNRGTWDKSSPDIRMQSSGEPIERPLNQQRAITILDGKFDNGETISFVNEILDHKKKGETRTTRSLTRRENLGITDDKQNVVGVIRLGEPRPLKKYEVDKNGNIKLDKNGEPIKTQDYIDSMIEGTDYDIDDNNLDKKGKQKYFYPITVLKDYRKNPKKITKHISQAYKEYDGTDTTSETRMQSSGQTSPNQNFGYVDKQKDVYSVTFTKSAQKNGENQKKIAFYRKNKSYWRENKDAQSGSITFTRALPYQQHQKTIIYDEINGKKVGKRKKAKWREYYEAFKDQMIKWLFNDKHFLEKAARNVGAIESYMRMMVMKDQGAVAGAAIEDGIVKHNSKNGERTKSLNSIIEAVGEENQTEFLNYCEAFRVLDLEKRNIYQKMTPSDARKEIAKVKNSKNAKLFEEQRKNFVEYNHELLWVLVDGGFITEQQYDNFIKVDPNFIPLAKNMDELEGYVDGFKDSKTMINVQHPMHKIGTSIKEVANPFLEMQRRTVEYYVKASRNKAGHIFVHDIANAIAQSAGGDVVAQNQGMVRKLLSRDRNGKPISHDGKQNVFYVWENGEKQYYQVADREIYIALRSFDAEQMGALSKIMNQTAGRASRLVRNTATMTPDFGLRNLVRDNMEAFISSEHGFLPLVDSLWGMYQMANDTQWFKEYQKMNGEHMSLNRDGEDVATVEHDIKDNVKFYKMIIPLIKKDYREFIDKDRSKAARAKSLLKLVATDLIPLQSIYKANKRLNDYLEVGTRIGEYRNARMGYKGLKGRLFETSGSTVWTTDMDLSRAKNTEMIAAYKSKDITLNFGQHGILGKELNRYIPFFNASLQGIYKLGNTIDDMFHAEDARRRQELWFKCVLMGAMGMAAALAGQGDDDYDEAPDYEHENFWILPNGIRIPKDQLFGKLIGGTVEKATAQYLKDGDVKELELIKDILGNFVIDKCTPALIDLGWGTIGNYDSFRKRSVTPEYMADKLGYLQKDLSTSKAGADISETIYKVTDGLFKALGYNSGGVDIGAKKVDFVISKTLSNLGKYATSLWELTGGNEKMTRGAEAEDKGGFAETSKELPYPLNQIVGTFATNRNSFQSISDFYERYRELKKLSSDESVMDKNQKKAWTAYQQAYKQDKKYRDALKAIKQDKSLTGAQKRQKADKIFKQQISMARKLHDWEKKHGLV